MFFLHLGMDGYDVEILGSACLFARSNRQLPDPDIPNYADYQSYCQFAGFTSEKLTFDAVHTHSDSLTTSSPAEGTVRSLGGRCGRWRIHAYCC